MIPSERKVVKTFCVTRHFGRVLATSKRGTTSHRAPFPSFQLHASQYDFSGKTTIIRSESMHSDHSTTDADLASDLSNLRLNGDKSNISLATDAHEEREVPGKGIGVFATKPIAAGSRVICEKPLLILSDDEDVLNLYRVVMALDEQSKSRFWALAASIEPHRDTDWIDELYSSWQGLVNPIGGICPILNPI